MKQFLSKAFFTFLLFFTNIFFSNPSLQKQNTSPNNSTVSFVYKNVETPKIKRKIAEDDSDIYDKINSYDFYRYSFNNRTFYLADVFKPHNLDLGCQELKLILNPQKEDSLPASFFKKNEASVFEEIYLINDKLTINYCTCSNESLKKIKQKALNLVEGTFAYNRIINSYNSKPNYILNHLEKAPAKDLEKNIKKGALISSANSEAVNNQAPLDHYLKSKYIKSNVQENNFAINSEAYPNCYHYVTDNAISTIIPRAYFTSSGSHQNLGKEWGYYISTVPEFEGTFISRVLIFDLIQIRSYNTREDQIKIKIVEHSNYKFLTTDNVILSYGDNNFCLGNPILESNIQYVAGTDNQNLKYHLNPGDKRYSSKDDKGFAFGNADVIYIGQGKNSDNKANVAKSIVNFSSTTIASIASTYLHLNLASSIAVEEAVSLLSDAFFDALYPKLYANTETTFNNKKKVVSFIRNPYDNFSTAGQQNNLLKHTLFRFQSYNGNDEKTKLKEIKANRQTPLLYKDDSDSINYRQEILSSELDDSYTAIVDHKLSIDVFNDDSIFFWKPDPSFLAQQSISWGYLIGKNVHVAKQIFNPGSKAIYAVFGTKFDQTIDFCPNESCYYNLLLLDAAPGTRIVIDGLCTITFSSKTYTNAWNETIVGAFQNNFESTVFLEKNKRYVLHVLRLESNFQYFGTAKFNILKQGKNNLKLSDCSFKDSNLSFFSSSINYNKISISYTIIPDEDTLITVSINSIDNCDPFLEILDSNFDLIVSNDDGGGNRDSALRIRLIKGQPIIIVTRLFSQNQTGKFNLNIFKGNYFPNISNQASGTKEHLLIDFSQACHLFYQFSLNNNSSVKIDSSHFPDTNYSVITRNSSFLYLSEIDYENPNTSLTIGNNEILIFEIVIRTPIAKNFSLEITV